MKLQDLHPYDKTIVGLNNLYVVDYKGDFFINSPCIMATDKTISTGNTYVLIYSRNTKNCIMHPIVLQDAYYDDGTIYLILQDKLTLETFTIDQRIECTGDHYKWILIDLDFFNDELNTDIGKRTTLSDNS